MTTKQLHLETTPKTDRSTLEQAPKQKTKSTQPAQEELDPNDPIAYHRENGIAASFTLSSDDPLPSAAILWNGPLEDAPTYKPAAPEATEVPADWVKQMAKELYRSQINHDLMLPPNPTED